MSGLSCICIGFWPVNRGLFVVDCLPWTVQTPDDVLWRLKIPTQYFINYELGGNQESRRILIHLSLTSVWKLPYHMVICISPSYQRVAHLVHQFIIKCIVPTHHSPDHFHQFRLRETVRRGCKGYSRGEFIVIWSSGMTMKRLIWKVKPTPLYLYNIHSHAHSVGFDDINIFTLICTCRGNYMDSSSGCIRVCNVSFFSLLILFLGNFSLDRLNGDWKFLLLELIKRLQTSPRIFHLLLRLKKTQNLPLSNRFWAIYSSEVAYRFIDLKYACVLY